MMNTITGLVSGPGSCEIARKKARYGNKAWLRWIDGEGVWHAAPLSVDAMKAALLAVGTQRIGIFLHHRRENHCHIIHWDMGVRIHRQITRGYGWVYNGGRENC